MKKDLSRRTDRISLLTSEIDGLYHTAAVQVGITDSILYVFYTMLVEGGSRPLSDIYKLSGMSRQTVNSAVRKLEAGGYITLTASGGRSKNVQFTDSGRDYAERTAGRIIAAERRIFDQWDDSVIDYYIKMLEEFISAFKKGTADLAAPAEAEVNAEEGPGDSHQEDE